MIEDLLQTNHPSMTGKNIELMALAIHLWTNMKCILPNVTIWQDAA